MYECMDMQIQRKKNPNRKKMSTPVEDKKINREVQGPRKLEKIETGQPHSSVLQNNVLITY